MKEALKARLVFGQNGYNLFNTGKFAYPFASYRTINIILENLKLDTQDTGIGEWRYLNF